MVSSGDIWPWRRKQTRSEIETNNKNKSTSIKKYLKENFNIFDLYRLKESDIHSQCYVF